MNYILSLKRLPSFLAATLRALGVFEDPLTVVLAYVLRRSPQGGVVRLRGGRVVHLSSDPADIVTVFLIFAREDYGSVVPGATVIDIGANIGVFSLFAAFSGAKDVYAFEPSASSYDMLSKNIQANGLGEIIHPAHRAVVGLPRGPVKFPRRSDVMNAILPDSSDSADFDLVPAIALSEILSPLESVDLLKSDCEGGEYDIFLKAGEADIRKVAEIRMECHEGPLDELIARFIRLGYQARQFMDGGYLWLSRTSSSRP